MSPVASGVFLNNLVSAEQYAAGLLDGYSDRYDLGIDRLKIGGIENEIIFNDYKINVTNHEDAVIITSIDGLNDADVRDTRDVNPGYDGETAFSSYYGGRTIVLSGFIRAHTLEKLRDMQEGIRSTFAPLEEKLLVFRGKTRSRDLQIKCRKTQPITMSETQTNFLFERQFQVTLRASDFRFEATKLSTEVLSYGSNFNGEVPIGNVVNNGNYLADPVIRIDGPLTAATQGGHGIWIENTVDQTTQSSASTYGVSASAIISGTNVTGGLPIGANSYLKIKAKLSNTTEVLASGEYFLVDTLNRTIYRYSAAQQTLVSAYAQLETDSEWIKLAPGTNPIYATTFTSRNPLVTFYYRHTFI